MIYLLDSDLPNPNTKLPPILLIYYLALYLYHLFDNIKQEIATINHTEIHVINKLVPKSYPKPKFTFRILTPIMAINTKLDIKTPTVISPTASANTILPDSRAVLPSVEQPKTNKTLTSPELTSKLKCPKYTIK